MANKNTDNRNITIWRRAAGMFSTIKFASAAVIVIAVTVLTIFLTRSCAEDHAEITVDNSINITPALITSMKEIGEWEFLSIADEELIDTVRKGFFSNDELIRIYHGTLRLGINMHKTEPRWIDVSGDSITVVLPPIELLDNDFIDEARTQSFFESGKWTDKDRADMYKRAYNQMRARCLTKENIRNAEKNAVSQFNRMMKSMGYNNVRVEIKAHQ